MHANIYGRNNAATQAAWDRAITALLTGSPDYSAALAYCRELALANGDTTRTPQAKARTIARKVARLQKRRS